MNVTLEPLKPENREQFIKDNQEAFNYGAMVEFGMRDNQIISREIIEMSIDGGEAYRIMVDGNPEGGLILRVEGDKGDLDILFTSPKIHSKGVGYAAWCEVEKLHPDPNEPKEEARDLDDQFSEGMFRFEKKIK